MRLQNKLLSIFLIGIVVSSFFQPASAKTEISVPSMNFADKLDSESYDDNTILIKFKENLTDAAREDIYRKYESTYEEEFAEVDIEKVQVPNEKIQELIGKYNNDPDVLYAEPNYTARAFRTTNDPSLPTQWGMYTINAAGGAGQSAWDFAGGQGVKVAILDTGIDESHQDLSGKVLASQNFSASATPSDNNGHGTHVAGVIAALADNNTGIAGEAYGASLMNVKVLDDDGSGDYSSIIKGITWAADNGAKVINMSLGGTNGSTAMEDAINYAWSKGVVVVAAAGNDGTTALNYPAAYPHVISVASTDKNDQMSSFSQRGSWVTVAAPGENIYSTYKGNAYETLSGTSMASPHVAGLAALIWSKGDCATNDCVTAKIGSSCDKTTGSGTNWEYGRINALKAVSDAAVSPNQPPLPIAPQITDQPIAITGASVDAIAKNAVTISFTTNVPSLGFINITKDKKFRKGIGTGTDGRGLTTSHTMTIGALKKKTKYYLQMVARDGSGKEIASGIFSLKTAKK